MKRTVVSFPITKHQDLKQQILLWAKPYSEIIYIDSNENPTNKTTECIFAIDALTSIQSDDIQQIRDYQTSLNDWCFGFITYDMKNELFGLTSKNSDVIEFPKMGLFQPKKIIKVSPSTLTLEYLAFCDDEIEEDYSDILSTKIENSFSEKEVEFLPQTSYEHYKEQFDKIQTAIKRGDSYELNYCIEFQGKSTDFNPYIFHNQLNNKTKAPFSTFLKWHSRFAMCASPERFLKHENRKLIAQPIKGTAKRGNTEAEDLELINYLKENQKERKENLMIVDLMRNDLASLAKPNSLIVEELCEVYTFPSVHQMISTISCQLHEDFIHPIDALFQCFPMASMTGVPKKKSLEIIEQVEDFKRGLYSGTIGYFEPNGHFDFNVVIRTLQYNAENHQLSLGVGSAITFEANAKAEYDECVIKAKAIQQLFSKT